MVRVAIFSRDITLQKQTEEELKLAKKELTRYSQNLEKQVRKRTSEIIGILKHTPAVVYMKDRKGRFTLINSKFEELFGIRVDQARGKTAYDIFPRQIAEKFQASDTQVLARGLPTQEEVPVSQPDGMHIYLSVKFPLYDDEGFVRGLCGISTDITALKKAADQLRRLSASIMNGQEKERTAIARELHDELGQMLTALRMDSVWLKERLKDNDPKAAERALTMLDLIDKSIDELRGMAIRLRPGST